jgi:hypothetical protein
MLNIGIETLFLTALIVVALVILLFYIVAIKLETKPETASTKLRKKPKKKHVKAPEDAKATFLKKLPEELQNVPAETTEAIPEAAEKQEILPIEPSEAASAELPEETSAETPETELLETQKAAPIETPETISEIPERPEEVPAEAAKEPGPPGCPYHLGYLRSRPKDSFVPDACLSCPRILDCLHKTWLKE